MEITNDNSSIILDQFELLDSTEDLEDPSQKRLALPEFQNIFKKTIKNEIKFLSQKQKNKEETMNNFRMSLKTINYKLGIRNTNFFDEKERNTFRKSMIGKKPLIQIGTRNTVLTSEDRATKGESLGDDGNSDTMNANKFILDTKSEEENQFRKTYVWGRNKFNNLGISSEKKPISEIPFELSLENNLIINKIFCSSENTFIIDKGGKVYGFGNAKSENMYILSPEYIHPCIHLSAGQTPYHQHIYGRITFFGPF